MICYPKFGPMPQEVLFAPAMWDKKGDFKDFLIDECSKESFVIYQTYFQGMRWIISDLEERLASTKKFVIKAGNNFFEVWATYVAITFDVTEFDNSENNTIFSEDKLLPLIINGHHVTVRFKDLPYKMGCPKLFEPIFGKLILKESVLSINLSLSLSKCLKKHF